MKYTLQSLCLMLFAFFCSCEKTQQIIITNNAEYEMSQVVEVLLSDLNQLPGEDDAFILKNSEGVIVPTQVTFDNKLIFKAEVPAHTSQNYTLTKGEKQSFEPLVFGRYFPERKDDFAWENDRVGFRFYGKALKSVQDPTNGLDLWYKRTSRLVLEDWYRKDLAKEASYHVDHGEGCDPYTVGPTLGAGAMAPFIEERLIRNENYDTYEILDHGPLRITAKLIYPPLMIDGKEVADVRIVSLDVGSQYTKIEQNYGEQNFPVVAGITKRALGDSIVYSKDNSYLIYAEPETEENGQIYIGLIFPDKFDKPFVDSYSLGKSEFQHVAVKAEYQKVPIVYYTGFGWSKFGFGDVKSFQDYTEKFVESLHSPIIVTVK